VRTTVDRGGSRTMASSEGLLLLGTAFPWWHGFTARREKRQRYGYRRAWAQTSVVLLLLGDPSTADRGEARMMVRGRRVRSSSASWRSIGGGGKSRSTACGEEVRVRRRTEV